MTVDPVARQNCTDTSACPLIIRSTVKIPSMLAPWHSISLNSSPLLHLTKSICMCAISLNHAIIISFHGSNDSGAR